MFHETVVRLDQCSHDDVGFQHRPEVIFSMADGFVWVSWPGSASRVVLGPYEGVKAMMQDFLDQSALGERLTKRAGR